jgi:hypothetical protein
MSSGDDSLPTAVLTAKDRDLRPLLEECAEALGLDDRQIGEMDVGLHEAWFFGIKTGHKVMVEAKVGQSDPPAVIHSLQDEFQDLMERCAEALNLTVGGTIEAWNYLGQAWIAGAQFWEVEIAARLIESQLGGFDEIPRDLDA